MTAILNPDSAFLPLTEAEERIRQPIDPWSDTMALKITMHDFNAAQAYRSQNQDWRWRVHDELYLAWVAQKYWEGTKVPRSSIPVYLAFEQVESMMPKLMGAIFGDAPWFQADPGVGTLASQAKAFRDLVKDQMDEAGVREVLRLAIKDAMIYGNGIVELSWISRMTKSVKWVPRWEPKQQFKMHQPGQATPLDGTSDMRRVLDKRETEDIENKPRLTHISIKDFYVDPNCPSPDVRKAEYVCTRVLKPIAWLDSLRDNKEFKIPSNVDLAEMAQQKSSRQADTTKSAIEMMRFGSWAPQNDETSDPAGKRIELITRTSKDRVVWVVNGERVIFNKPNPYGFINYYDAFYSDVPDRFYAMSICDVIEGEQRFRTSLINARVDELALTLHAPVQYRRGLNIPSYQLRVRPGQVIQVDEPGKDYIRTEMGSVTQNAYIEDQASDARAQKTTGLSDLIASGMPQAGGNSASRTATGIGAQVNAGSSRIQYLVENLEDTFIEPLLNDVVRLNMLFPPIGTPVAQIAQLSKVKLFMRASAKMSSRMALMQTFPLLLQSILNPAFLQHLAQAGKTINFEAFFEMLLDTTGVKNRADLIQPMSPQEQQQLQQQNMAEMQLKMGMQKERLQSQQQQTTEKLTAQQQIAAMKIASEDKNTSLDAHGRLLQAMLPGLTNYAFEEEAPPV